MPRPGMPVIMLQSRLVRATAEHDESSLLRSLPHTLTGAAGAASYLTCETPSDCAWGEIDHEILVFEDCICLFGCPYLALNRQTVERRLAQYTAICDPYTDGQGNPCPIDDCMPPPELECVDNECYGPPLW